MQDGGDSVDLAGDKASPAPLILFFYTLVCIFRHWYLRLSVGQLIWIWHAVALSYGIGLVMLGVPDQITAVIVTIPAGVDLFLIKMYHEKNIE